MRSGVILFIVAAIGLIWVVQIFSNKKTLSENEQIVLSTLLEKSGTQHAIEVITAMCALLIIYCVICIMVDMIQSEEAAKPAPQQLLRIIALSAWKKSGKDTVAGILKEFNFARVAFADGLKDCTANAYDLPRHWFDDDNIKDAPTEKYDAPREDHWLADFIAKNKCVADVGVLPTTGKRWTYRGLLLLEAMVKRAVDPLYWVRKATPMIENYLNDGRPVVITDLRNNNEIDALKELVFKRNILLYVVRVDRFEEDTNPNAADHVLDDYPFDYTLSNKGTIDDLRTAVVTMLAEQGKQKVA